MKHTPEATVNVVYLFNETLLPFVLAPAAERESVQWTRREIQYCHVQKKQEGETKMTKHLGMINGGMHVWGVETGGRPSIILHQICESVAGLESLS